MSIHASRPLPPRTTSAHPAIVDPPRTPPAAQATETPPAVANASPSPRADDPGPASATRAAHSPETRSGPWYRREAWLAAMALAVVIVAAAVWAPEAARYPLIGASGVCMVVAVVLLVRQGVAPPHDGA